MKARRLVHAVRVHIRRGRRQFVLSSFGIAVGVASLAFFGALSAGVRGVVLGQVFHADRIELEPARAGFDVGGMLGGGGPRPEHAGGNVVVLGGPVIFLHRLQC